MSATIENESDTSAPIDTPESLMAEVRAGGFMGGRNVDDRTGDEIHQSLSFHS